MKRKPTGEWGETIPAALYMDDVATIHGLFREVCDRVHMEVGGWELDSPDDLSKIDAREARDLRIIGSPADAAPAVILYGSRYGFHVYLPDSGNTAMLGLKAAVERVLKARRVRAVGGLTPTPVFMIGVLVGIVGSLNGFPYRTTAAVLAIALLVAGWVIGVVRLWTVVRRAGVVYMRPSSTEVGGLKVSRDVALVLLGSLTGAIFTLIVGLTAKYVFGLTLP